MIAPQRAAVRPRVRSAESGESLLLEDEIREIMTRRRAWGVILVLGPPGSGKTTALRHLAAVLPGDSQIQFLDEPKFVQLSDRPRGTLLICAMPPNSTVVDSATGDLIGWDGDHDTKVRQAEIAPMATFHLAEWDRDDLVEYLLAVHPSRCAAVMHRIAMSGDSLLNDLPELWQPVLDRLAADPSLPYARSAFHRYLQELLADTDLIERARSACLNAVFAAGQPIADLETLARPGFADELKRVLRHDAVQYMLAAERIAADLHAECDCDFLARRLPREVVRAAAHLIREDDRALDHLRRLLAGPCWSHAMSASLLHATGTGWIPTTEVPPVLARAYLDGAAWAGVRLSGADLTETELSSANLSGADLSQSVAFFTRFRNANLTVADVTGMQAVDADLSGASLLLIKAERANFANANLEGACAGEAHLRAASFKDASLQRAFFLCTNLTLADFTGARIQEAVFSDVDLREAVLSKQCLREAIWQETRLFSRAKLDRCDLEGLSLPGADFSSANLEGALLTATVMPQAIFRNANLRDTGLADIEWEGADLRGADLTGATFHMGSTRSGLVGSPIACEGSRTGFYTDDYEEQMFKAPEEIRKANLCGADLRGACITDVDFYLVDLRGALLDPEQEEHVRRCKAILETPVC